MKIQFTRDLAVAPAGHTAVAFTKNQYADLPEEVAALLIDNHHAVPAGDPHPDDAGKTPGVASPAELSEAPAVPPAATVADAKEPADSGKGKVT